MANQIRGGVGPGAGPIQPQKPGLNQTEAGKVKQQQAQKVSAQDAARLAQQAGFQRTQKKQGKRGLDIGDSSRAPIPLPDDETDTDVWSPDRLDNAQENLTLATTQFDEASKAESAPMAESVVSSSFLPTEEGVQKLQLLAERPAPQPIALDEATTSVKNLFNIELGDEVSVGHKVLATGLVVAGEAGSVAVDKGRLDEKRLASGVQKVTERSNQAVGEAQKMSKGVNRELNLQRTFVFKR